MELKEIGSDDLAPVAELNRAIWFPTTDPAHFLDYYRTVLATTWSQSHVKVMGLMQGDRLLSTFKLYSVDVRIAGRVWRTAGIGALMTLPAYRGQGHASHMLKAALAALRNAYDIGMLFAEINPLFFARLGFVQVPTSTHEYDTTRAAVQLAGTAAIPEHLIREAHEIDLEDVMPLYDRTSRAFPMHAVRDIWLWRHRLELARMRERVLGFPRGGYRLVVLGEPGNVQAYMWLSCRAERWDIEEIAGLRGDALSHLLEWTLREAREAAVPRVRVQVRGSARAAWGHPASTSRGEPAFMIHPLASSLDLDTLDNPEANLLWKTDWF